MEYRFDLFDVTRVFLQWKKYILGFAFLVALIIAGYLFTVKTYYRGYGAFYPASSVISGRINLFRESQQDWIDYFGEENEVDRAFVISGSSTVVSFLIDSFKMAEHYNIDVNADPNGQVKVVKKFLKNYKVSRTGYNHIEVTFTDPDKKKAAAIVNVAMNKIEDALRDLFIGINRQLSLAIDIRKDSLHQELTMLTDSLVKLRVQYGIYDIVAPSRQILVGSARGSGVTYAEGLERIQNLEELKDKMAIDKAKYMSLSNEFKTSIFKGFPMIHVVQWASDNGPKAGPFRIIMVLAGALLATLFGLVVACLIDIFKQNKHRYAA
jgi:uncharacterized protein involved in exopolysaccharide biosynthesis